MKKILLALSFARIAAFAAEPGFTTLVSHRGESFDAPENTLPAYETAVERGFGFECDIYLSADGKVFTFHDGDFTRTTGGANTNKCSEATWSEISALDVGGWGKWKGSRFAGTRPALLEEVLALARDGRKIYIEIKTGPEIVPHVEKIFASQTRATPENALFISFNAETCAAVKKAMPEYKVFWLVSPRKNSRWADPRAVIEKLESIGADGVDAKFIRETVTAEYVRTVRDAGFEFHVWTVDELENTLLAFERGAQTVTTNCARKQLDAWLEMKRANGENGAKGGTPLRAAVFTGPGARGVGMFRFLALAESAPEIEASYVDGAAIRAGALRNVDLVLMPGGLSNLEEKDLGPEGQKELRRFIEEGGAYVGSCAGAFLLMKSEKREKPLGIVPYKHRSGSWGGEAMLQVKYTEEAGKLSGIRPGKHMERFNGGPVMDPSGPVPGADFKTMAVFASNLHSSSSKPGLPSMGGGASAVAGTFGKGRVWVFAGHPEYYPGTWDSLKAAIKYTTGRDVTLTAPQRRKGQLATGFCCSAGLGAESAEFARALLRDGDFDVEPVANPEIDRTRLQHLDVYVVPDVAETSMLERLFAPNSAAVANVTAFMDRGGRVVTWGRSAKYVPKHANCAVVSGAAEATQFLRDLKNAPLPPPRPAPAPKAPGAVRAALYCGRGAAGAGLFHWISILQYSPSCSLQPVDGNAVNAGALDNADLFVSPGGHAVTQAKALKPEGCAKLVDFVRSGGAYFGSCAGCYLAMSPASADKPEAGRTGMLPYKAQKTPYRGGAELRLKFTKNAEMFGLGTNESCWVRYHGGPVPLPAEPVPGADIREVAVFACDGVYAYSTNTAPTMAKHPAVLAGTLDNGRIVAVSPHPENWRNTQKIILGGLKYLTGREFSPEFPQRTRGNLSTGIVPINLGADGARLVADLLSEPSLDVRPADGELISYGELEHLDALVLVHPGKKTLSRAMRRFAENGGRIFAYGTAAELKNLTGLPDGTYSLHQAPGALAEALCAYAAAPAEKRQ